MSMPIDIQEYQPNSENPQNITDHYVEQIRKNLENAAAFYQISKDEEFKEFIEGTCGTYQKQTKDIQIDREPSPREYFDLTEGYIMRAIRLQLLKNGDLVNLLRTYNVEVNKPGLFATKENVQAIKEWCGFIQKNGGELLSSI